MFKILAFFLLLLALLTPAPKTFLWGEEPFDYTVIEDQAKVPILTPSLTAAKVLKIRLKNGLEAYLVSDPNVDKSSAAMTVRVGSWDEPKEFPGLAHFLEHMLFLGTKKYPNESEYDRFITEHGGLSNAFTSNDHTAYMFSIDNSVFEEALDRFSSFFKEPLFNPSGVARELQAIDQEYAKNKENDDIRELFVYKEIANPEHPFHAFNMGNSATLSKVSQETLKGWYRSHYSANLMRLIVISPLPIDKLRNIVVNDFKNVPSSGRKLLDLDMPIFSSASDRQIQYIEPVKNIRTVSLMWDLPAKFSHMQDSKPETLICYVLGHEGKESLLAQLKREKLAEGLDCGSVRLGPNNTQFYLQVTLTDLGIKQVHTVIERVFQAIANFKQKGVPRYLFDEVQNVALLRYQYQQREEAFQKVMKHASWLAHEDLETYPEQTLLTKKFDPQATAELLNYLTPQNAHVDLIAPSKVTNAKPDKKEQWIGVEYSIKSIPAPVIESWANATPNPAIDLPPPNPFIPTNLALVNAGLSQVDSSVIVPRPELIVDNEKGKIYFGADSKFLTPQISWIFEIKTPQIIQGDTSKVVLGDLYVKLLKDALSSSSYPATLAGLNYDITRSENGISLEIEGYSEKASLLLEEILKQIRELSFTQERFRVYKDSLLRDYQNSALNPPIMQASEMLKSLIYKDFTTDKQKAIAIRKMTYEKMVEFSKSIFDQIYVQGLLYGNMTEEQAKHVSETILENFHGAPYPVSEQPKIQVIMLPEKMGPFYIASTLSVQGNAALLGIEIPEFSFKNRAAQQILMQAMDEPFFAELRTRQQTGYLVYSTGEELEKHLYNFFAVQSNTHSSRDLLARFELFIEGYLQEIHADLPEDRFKRIGEALIINLKTPAKNIQDMAKLLYKFAFKYDGDFDWIDKRIATLEELKYGEFLSLAQEFLGKHNKRRFGLLLNGILPDATTLHYSPLSNILQLRKLSTFQTSTPEKKPEEGAEHD